MILHGGDNGELPPSIYEKAEDQEKKYVFDCTFEQVQENHLNSKYYAERNPDSEKEMCLIPELQDIFNLVNSNKIT